MQIINVDDNIVIEGITKEELDLDKTFNCGQAFRWIKHEGGFWYCAINSQIVVLKQEENKILTNVDIKDKDWLVDYLNLDMDYNEEMSKILTDSDKYLTKAYEAGKGIHILRQDTFETIITFILSQMNSMNNIRNSSNKLCKTFGKPVVTSIRNIKLQGYMFPTYETLADVTIDDLMQCSVGFRAKYIKGISQYIKDTPDFISKLQKLDYNQAMKSLTSFYGIGDKVANCICLFGLHHIEAFPIDTHINQIIAKHYKGRLDTKRFGNIAGIAQQYMFYYKALCKED